MTGVPATATHEELKQMGFISHQHRPKELSDEFLDLVLDIAYEYGVERGVHIVVRGLYA